MPLTNKSFSRRNGLNLDWTESLQPYDTNSKTETLRRTHNVEFTAMAGDWMQVQQHPATRQQFWLTERYCAFIFYLHL